jgi:hypothetical protein
VRATELLKNLHRTDDDRFDGHLVSPDKRSFAPGTPLSEVPAAEPRGGPLEPTTILYVNGMNSTKDSHATDLQKIADRLQKIADRTGARVVGLHNATSGLVGDFVQAFNDRFDRGDNPAVGSTVSTVLAELEAGRPVHLMAYSHGTLIVSRALSHVREALSRRGLTPSQIDDRLANVEVETFAGSASAYPDGPRYRHYINTADLQSAVYGLGFGWDPRRQNAGRDAEFVEFNSPDLNPLVTHDLLRTYLPHRHPSPPISKQKR